MKKQNLSKRTKEVNGSEVIKVIHKGFNIFEVFFNLLEKVVDILDFGLTKLNLWVLLIPIILIPVITIYFDESALAQFLIEFLTK